MAESRPDSLARTDPAWCGLPAISGGSADPARLRPELNQVELHPLLQQPKLVQFCSDQGIHITAYSPLGSGDRPAGLKKPDEPVLLDNPVIGSIAAEHGCSPAQVLLAWHLQCGISTIHKSVTSARLRENLAAADLNLSPADLDRIASLDQGLRLVDGCFGPAPAGLGPPPRRLPVRACARHP